jgi:hypothetical protein
MGEAHMVYGGGIYGGYCAMGEEITVSERYF